MQPGEYLAIMGESGVGKSTLLNLLAGLDDPDTGRVVLEGTDLSASTMTRDTLLRRRCVGFVFQAFHVLPYLTVEQNVALPLELLRVAEPDRSAARRAHARGGRDVGARPRHTRASSPAAKCSGSRSRARSCTGRGWCSRTSRPEISTRATPRRSLPCCATQVKANAGGGILITHSRTAADTADRILVLDAHGLQPWVSPALSAAARRRFADGSGAMLLLSQLREQPRRLAITVLAIALGVALGAAVYLVNTSALNEFGLATKRLVGEADLVIRGPREGFSEQLFVELAREPAVSVASPVLELEVALPGRRRHAQGARVGSISRRRAAAGADRRHWRRRLRAVRAGRHLS